MKTSRRKILRGRIATTVTITIVTFIASGAVATGLLTLAPRATLKSVSLIARTLNLDSAGTQETSDPSTVGPTGSQHRGTQASALTDAGRRIFNQATSTNKGSPAGAGGKNGVYSRLITNHSSDAGKSLSIKAGTGMDAPGGANSHSAGAIGSGGTLVLSADRTVTSGTVALTSNINANGGVAARGPTGSSPLALDAVITWQGGTLVTNNVWNLALNWVGLMQPTSSDTALFDNTANSNNLAPNIGIIPTSVGAITFASGTTNAYNISGTATLTVGSATVAGITNSSATNQQFSVNTIALGISQTWAVQSTGNLSLSSAVSLGSNTLTLSGSSTGVGSVSGVISSAGSLTKAGSGTWTLSGANSYGGTTSVSSGTLLVNNTTGSGTGTGAVTVSNSGTTLGGTGTINGTVTINSDARILGGTGAAASGALTLANNLTLNSGSIIELALGGAGAHSTLARAGGTWSFQSNQLFTFIDLGATIGTYNNIITGLASDPGTSNWTITNPGFVGTFTFDGANIDLALTIVPEPGTWFAGALAFAALGYTQRRRFVRARDRL